MHITIYLVNEWAGMYVNGELVFENHDISVYDLASEVGEEEFTLEVISFIPEIEEFIKEHSTFPTLQSSLPI